MEDGFQFGEYFVDKNDMFYPIGKGTSGDIIKCKKAQNIYVMKKITLPEGPKKDETIKKINKEVSIMKEMNKKSLNILQLEETLWIDETFSVILEFCELGDLNGYLNEQGCLGEEEAISLLHPIATALSTLHTSGYIHRDLKLSNILLKYHRDGQTIIPKLGDFGSAVSLKGGAGVYPKVQEELVGTLAYMAPELVLGEGGAYSKEIDIWSFGVMLFQLLFGFTPIQGGQQYKELPLKYYMPKFRFISKSAFNLITGCLVSNPKDRLTAQELSTHSFFQGGTQPIYELIFDGTFDYFGVYYDKTKNEQKLKALEQKNKFRLEEIEYWARHAGNVIKTK